MRAEREIRVGLRVVLVLSLLLNAAGAGVLWRIASFRDEVGLLGTMLPRAERRVVRAAMGAERDRLVPFVSALGEARRRFVAIAAAEPFDEAAARAALDDVARRSAALQAASQAVMLEALAAR